MSATEHRRQAALHDDKAGEHQAQYDPNAPKEVHFGSSDDIWDMSLYNPTGAHLSAADEHRDHARDHQLAAEQLDGFEEAECKAFPPQIRGLCPLIGAVQAVADIDSGVRVQLAKDVNAKAALAHVRCHLAHGRRVGRHGMDSCPLYLKGVAAEAGPEGRIDLTVDAEEPAVQELRRRTREHVAPAPSVATP